MLKIYLICLSYLFMLYLESAQCDPQYWFNMDVNGWLKVHTIPATWEEAFLRCHYEGAVLASPLTQQLSKALEHKFSVISQQSIHLGTHDLYSNGDYFSVEGIPLDSLVLKWSNFRGTGDCLAMSRDGRAFITKCMEPRPYICYKKLDNLTMNICGTFDDAYQFYDKTGSCYKRHDEYRTWTDAFKICAAEGGYLLILNDATEAAIVREMFPVRTGKANEWENFHVGLRAWGPERTWITIHGERIEDVFHDWNPGQPDNYQGVQNVGALLRLGTLDDHSIDKKSMFVCEKDPKIKRFEELPEGLAEILGQ
ncbi:C-type mannose receptor 2-like isoform X1 [Spodoptera litura]|uniref:C-type mannose receptor 2-like isoform X1 n=2 Tax=Spodoptera litura TaxID=69820 RepID=A0A9J7EMM0_SPOLT|nr:C-type mannose receptor 2-like isoform X1 [Spodoptera litura]